MHMSKHMSEHMPMHMSKHMSEHVGRNTSINTGPSLLWSQDVNDLMRHARDINRLVQLIIESSCDIWPDVDQSRADVSQSRADLDQSRVDVDQARPVSGASAADSYPYTDRRSAEAEQSRADVDPPSAPPMTRESTTAGARASFFGCRSEGADGEALRVPWLWHAKALNDTASCWAILPSRSLLQATPLTRILPLGYPLPLRSAYK